MRLHLAAQQGNTLDTTSTFVTGLSLGGYAAEFAALNNGFAGASYGAPGMPGFASSGSPPSNFVSFVTQGDGIANFATDTGLNWLARVLEGGTWAAGRRIARERRPDGAPPLAIESDGTVF